MINYQSVKSPHRLLSTYPVGVTNSEILSQSEHNQDGKASENFKAEYGRLILAPGVTAHYNPPWKEAVGLVRGHTAANQPRAFFVFLHPSVYIEDSIPLLGSGL